MRWTSSDQIFVTAFPFFLAFRRQTVLGVGSMLILSRPEYLEWIQKTNFTNYDKGYAQSELEVSKSSGSRIWRVPFSSSRSILLSAGSSDLDLPTFWVSTAFLWLTARSWVLTSDLSLCGFLNPLPSLPMCFQWSHTRKVTSNIFSAFQFRTWIEHVLHGELINVVSILDKTAARKDNQILLPELFFRFTLSSFSKMAFTTDVKCLTGDPNCLTEPVEFAHAFDFVQGMSKSVRQLDKRNGSNIFSSFEISQTSSTSASLTQLGESLSASQRKERWETDFPAASHTSRNTHSIFADPSILFPSWILAANARRCEADSWLRS